MDTKQPEALRLADTLDLLAMDMKTPRMAATELRRQHAENETLRAGLDAARLEIESLQKAATGRHALQATGAHCARYCEAQAFRITLRNLHAENERLRTCNKDAQHEIASLRERVQQLGQLARDVNSRRVTELEAQLAAVGAGGVEPLRKRCLHQISEPAKAGWCDGCSPDNCGGCASSAAPVDADTGRLNWLERHSDGFYNLDRISAIVGKGFLTGPFTLGLQTNHATLREAIDAARAAQKGSQ